ncbi:uncharacterized protein LOC113316782 [Papaver somniferum]|uniref:uncharacterized protein LOC113316782 n=1 Tax=Papaver somniferum TaxID=3469 RepID=UPI000E6F9413|nr:uncharacterized protein LOC113316782 [Papaver somniferum]
MAELREMMTVKRNDGRKQLEEAVEEAGKNPFKKEIQRAPIPSKCSLPAFTSIFDGSACAIQHVKAYSRCLLQWENYDAVMCKYFSASLVGEDLKWFEGLPVESIGSFHHLQNIFLGQYISNNLSRPGIETAFGLRRRTNESLRHPTTCWRTMCSEMGKRVDERHLILAFINALFATDLLYTQIFRVKRTITMSELREFQEEYIALEEKQRDMKSLPVAVTDSKGGNTSLLPRLTNAVASTSQRNQGRSNAEMEQKLVAMGSADHAEFEKEYKDRRLQKYGNNDIAQPVNSTGHQTNYKKKAGRIVWEQVNLPKLNITVDKVWETALLMDDIPEPHNAGKETPPGRRSKDYCVYHRFHGHTTSNCRIVRKIILRMIEQGKLDHFLLNQT